MQVGPQAPHLPGLALRTVLPRAALYTRHPCWPGGPRGLIQLQKDGEDQEILGWGSGSSLATKVRIRGDRRLPESWRQEEPEAEGDAAGPLRKPVIDPKWCYFHCKYCKTRQESAFLDQMRFISNSSVANAQ